MDLKGKNYWRSLDQIAETAQFKEFLHREFPKGTPDLAGDNSWSRRSFLSTMGASLALAGLAGCRRPVEKIVPYVTRPEDVEPGIPNKYATTMPFGLSSYGVIVTSHEGRPTFISGNELHPSTKGAVTPTIQASILGLYDPDRSQAVLKDKQESSWDDFIAWWSEKHFQFIANKGEGLAILSESFNSPTISRLKKEFEKKFPKAKWVSWEAVSDENIYNGIELATGKKQLPVYDYGKAKVILSLDSDLLGNESEMLTATRGFAQGRRVLSQDDNMNRLYVVETALSATGMMADHRLKATSSEIIELAKSIASAVGLQVSAANSEHAEWLKALADDLNANKGNCLVVAGRRQPAEIHALVAAINNQLDNDGVTVSYYEPKDAILSDRESLKQLADDLNSNKVENLLIFGGNPAFDGPNDFGIAKNLRKAKETMHFSDAVNESYFGGWHIPRAHYLESWGDCNTINGASSVIQPLIEPLFGAKTDTELLSLIVNGEATKAHDTVQETWKKIIKGSDFDRSWNELLHDGVYANSSSQSKKLKINDKRVVSALAGLAKGAKPKSDALEVSFYPSIVFNGRFANNGWLQELPDTVSKLTWDNAALISPHTATELNLENEDMVKLSVNGETLEIPVWISPGQTDNVLAISLGHGRKIAGRVGTGVGFDAYPLRSSKAMYSISNVTLTKLDKKHELACTQDHGSMEGRPIVRENTLAGYKEKVEFFPEEIKSPPPLSLWNEHLYDNGNQWGMSIDLNSCTGCNSCVSSCQAENNIPVIGKEQVREGREMHWMRVDRYYAGDTDNPEVVSQPMACQHCEMAPCEEVCPVSATSHDEEGLNVMVYNRCIGTRYCSNNCPYKVRRFNFFNYTSELPELVQMAQNPDVTVRFRGVMEKCTYCIQRISIAKSTAKTEGRNIADGEIATACEKACPAQAIVFGNINDPNSRVSQLKKNNRQYRVLEELNIRPRTSYLAKLRNPNPALQSKNESEEKKHG